MTEQDRPLVSFALLAYNQERFIREAVEGALAQTYSPLQVILSDDCSTDRTFEVMQQMALTYAGPHTIQLNRNERNLGLAYHINHVMQISEGQLIVVAAGDDFSLPQRVEALVKEWRKRNFSSGSIYSSAIIIDDLGRTIPTVGGKDSSCIRLSDRNSEIFSGVYGCSHAWTRDVATIFGAYDERILQEDLIIPLRSCLLGSICFISEPLVKYRIHRGTISRISYLSYRDRLMKMRRYWIARLAVFEQFERDVDHAAQLTMLSADDETWLRLAMSPHRYYAQCHVDFFRSTLLGKFRTIFGSLGRVPVIQSAKWLVIATAPWLYGARK